MEFDLSRKDVLRKMSKGPATDFQLKETELINASRRALFDGKPKDALEKLRLMCLSRGATGILDISRAFRKIHGHGEKWLNQDDFTKGIRDTGIECTDEEAQEIFDTFDTDCRGYVHMHEFLYALRPPMPQGRLNIISKAFEKLDPTGDGFIRVEDFKGIYSVQNESAYTCGDLTENQILSTFVGHFEDGGTEDGKITKDEFMDYYCGVSASIDDDCYFDLMMRQFYKL